MRTNWETIDGRAGRRRPARAVAGVLALLTTIGGVVMVTSALPAAAATYTPAPARQWLNLNEGWKFIKTDVSAAQNTNFDDTSWQSVTVPHTWNAVDGANGGNSYYRGIGWYRRHFAAPANLSGRAMYLEFAGVNQVADVWVNGTKLGQHIGGYARFRFDATAALKAGQDNVIAVKVNSANNGDIAPLSGDFTMMGGIYRSVGLWAVDPLSVRMTDYAGDGVYLRQRGVSASSATVDVTTKAVNGGTASRSVAVRTVITDAAGTVVADQTSPSQTLNAGATSDVAQTVTIANPHRWDGLADPYLYKANIEVRDTAAGMVTDVVTVPLGLRTFSVNANTGFFLNGHPYNLHGVNLHQDFGGVGWAQTDATHSQDWAQIRELGANVVRLAHYQHDQNDYNEADAAGVVVWTEIPTVNGISTSSAFTTNTENMLRELIRQNYNHPSVVFWGIGNELKSSNTANNNVLSRLAAIVKAEDPDRLSTYASCCVADNSALNNHTDVSAYNKYYGWYTGSTGDLGRALDSLHSASPSRKIGLSEYGAGANVTQHALNPSEPSNAGQWHPEEYQALLHESSWKQLNARPYIWGAFVWAMYDFASDFRNEGGQPGINDKGLVTRDRATRKDSFYWYKANWSSAPTVYITSRRWTQRTTAATEVKVYSNASSVTLTLNGASLGTRSSTDHIFKWTGVTLRRGQNTVTATATINGTTYTDAVTWTLS